MVIKKSSKDELNLDKLKKSNRMKILFIRH